MKVLNVVLYSDDLVFIEVFILELEDTVYISQWVSYPT